jgi:DNA-binding transcriptional ArsR family regulator
MTNANRHFKDAIYEPFAGIGKADASPKRLKLLDLLRQAPRTVEVLAKEAGLSVANASGHLHILAESRLADIQQITQRMNEKSIVLTSC